VCAGRHRKRTPCTRAAILIDDAERLILEHHQANVQIPAHVREQLRWMLGAEFDHLLASTESELADLTSRRDQLEAQRLKLLRAYYDDAVTLPVLKTEQHRLADQIEAINARIDAHHGNYANAKAELDDTLDLLADAASIYERGDDETRRLCNQAFFTKVYLDENDQISADTTWPFGILLDPAAQAQAQTWADDPAAYAGTNQTRRPMQFVAGLNFDDQVSK